MNRQLSTFLLASVMATPTLAANWVPLGEGGNGQFQVAVDLDSIQKSGSHLSVLEKFTYRTPAKYTGGRLIYVIKSNQSYDCEQRKTLLLNGFAYSDLDATVAIKAIRYTDHPGNYYAVAKSSVEERILNLVCSNSLAVK